MLDMLTRRSMQQMDLKDIQVSADERNKWSPDYSSLEQFAFHMFFAYDRLQPELPEYGKFISERCVHLPVGFTMEKFVMQKSLLGKDTYPVIQRKNYIATPPRRIKGQLYYLQTEAFKDLDSLRRNGVEFHREYVEILVPYLQMKKLLPLEEGGRHKSEYKAIFDTEHPSVHVKKSVTVKAFTYVGVNDYWDGLSSPEEFGGITPYQWGNVRHYNAHNPDIGSYYYFTKREFFD